MIRRLDSGTGSDYRLHEGNGEERRIMSTIMIKGETPIA